MMLHYFVQKDLTVIEPPTSQREFLPCLLLISVGSERGNCDHFPILNDDIGSHM